MTSEDQILTAARDIFYRKGLAGARMQEIADKAGINKAMLHYYFKTKELLFHKVFVQAFDVFVGQIAEILNGKDDLKNKITNYVNHTVDALLTNPAIPVFVLNELTYNPDRLTALFIGRDKIDISRFKHQVEERKHAEIFWENLLIDMIALCVYPFVMAPVLKKMIHKTDAAYIQLLQSRKKEIIDQLLKRI